jgi:hypothetical protein
MYSQAGIDSSART